MFDSSPTSSPTVLQEDEVLSLLRPGSRIFIQGLASEPLPLKKLLLGRSSTAGGVHWFGVLIPGINRFDYAAGTSADRFTGLFIGTDRRSTADQGRSNQLPLHYSQAYRYFASQRFDLAIIQVSPPDETGRCSFGVNADFVEAVIPGAVRTLAYVNDRMPRTRGPSIAWSALDFVVPVTSELLSPVEDRTQDAVVDLVARNVATLVRDGDCIQLGIGQVPAAVLRQLTHCKDLGLHSGLVTDDARVLVERGVLTGGRKSIDRGLIVTNAVYGSSDWYDFAKNEIFEFRSVGYTHSISVLARIDNLVSVNSAIEVDLWGQVNSESVFGHQVSGTGGLVDFARGAALSNGGRSIIALSSLTSSGRSRIVPRLAENTPTSMARSDIGIVVTEHGIAHLEGLTIAERMKALIRIAAPSVREDLKRGWR